jgi:hypothetical protein
MADLTLPLITATIFAGFFFKDKKTPRNIENIRNTVNANEKPNGNNIYDSNRVNEINEEMLAMSAEKYKLAKNPNQTGVVHPLYKLNQTYNGSNVTSEQQTIAEFNRNYNPYEKPQESIETRPMFNGSDISQENFTSLTNNNTLTGQSISNEHTNMTPFFFFFLKQNIEEFSNTSLLGKYTGETDTFKHKEEVGNMFKPNKENVYGTPIDTSINADRYIQSIYKQNEKPFQDTHVKAVIAGTEDNNIRPGYKTIDELRVGTNQQISFEGRKVSGKMGDLRGIQSKLEKRNPETFYTQSPDQWLVTTGKNLASKAAESFYLKPTDRTTTSYEHYGGAAPKDHTASIQRLSKNGNQTFDALVQEDQNTTLDIDTTRNLKGKNSTNDYGKNSLSVYETERATTSVYNTGNIYDTSKGQKTRLMDDIKTTLKQTVLENDNSGYINSTYNKNSTNLLHSGISDLTAKPTHKQSTLLKGYLGQADNFNEGMGYLVTKYDAKTTGKETIHLKQYKGTALGSMKQTDREKYQNMEIDDSAEILNKRSTLSGPQKFKTSGGTNVVGTLVTSDNTLFKEQKDTRDQLNPNLQQRITYNIGEQTNSVVSKTSSINNTRIQGDYISKQLKSNPYYNLR